MGVKGLLPAHLNQEKWDGCEWCCDDILFDSEDMSLELFHPLRDDNPQVVHPNYCPMCGRPLTGEAWAELEGKVAVETHPAVKGRWIEKRGPKFFEDKNFKLRGEYGVIGYTCSVCGRFEKEKEPFCNCGADMKEANE